MSVDDWYLKCINLQEEIDQLLALNEAKDRQIELLTKISQQNDEIIVILKQGLAAEKERIENLKSIIDQSIGQTDRAIDNARTAIKFAEELQKQKEEC